MTDGDRHLHLLFAAPLRAEYGDAEYHAIVESAFNGWFTDVYIPQAARIPGVSAVSCYTAADGYSHAPTLPAHRFMLMMQIAGDVDRALGSAALCAERWARVLPAAVDVETLVWMTYVEIGAKTTADPAPAPVERHATLTFSDPLRPAWATAGYNAALEDTFNRWLEDRHVAEMLAIPGYRAATRYKRPDSDAWTQGATQPRYLTIYEFDGDLRRAIAATKRHNKEWIADLPAGMDAAQTQWRQYTEIASVGR